MATTCAAAAVDSSGLRRGRSRTRSRHTQGGGGGGAASTGALLVSSASAASLSLPSWARLVERKPAPPRNDGWMWEGADPSSAFRRDDSASSPSSRPSHRRQERAKNSKERRDPPRKDPHRANSSSSVLNGLLDEEDSILRTLWYHHLSRELDVRIRQVVGRHILEEVVGSAAARDFFFVGPGGGGGSVAAPVSPNVARDDEDAGRRHTNDGNDDDDDDEFAAFFSLEPDGGGARTWSSGVIEGGGDVGVGVDFVLAEADPRKRPRHNDDDKDVGGKRVRSDEEAHGNESIFGPKSSSRIVPPSPLLHRDLLMLQRRLPVLVVAPGPYDRLDRQSLVVPELVRHIRSSCTRTCCVWVDVGACDADGDNAYGAALANRHGGGHEPTTSAASSFSHHHRPWKMELLRQCLLQESPNFGGRRSHPNQPHSLPDGHGWTERIVEWARGATKFDDLCVVLEASPHHVGTVAGSNASAQRLEALKWMEHVRGHYGVPFKVVLMGPPVGVTDISLQASTGPGAFGWRVTTVNWRSPYDHHHHTRSPFNKDPGPRQTSAGTPQGDRIEPITPATSPLCCHLLHMHQTQERQHPQNSTTSAALARIQSLLDLRLPGNANHQDGVDHIRDVHSSSLARSVMECKRELARSLLSPASFFVPMLTSALLHLESNPEPGETSTYRPHLPREVLRRLQWFLLHPGARRYVTGTMNQVPRPLSSWQLLRHLSLRAGKLNVLAGLMSVLSPPGTTGPPRAPLLSSVDGAREIQRATLERLLRLRSARRTQSPNEPKPLLPGLHDPTWHRQFSSDDDPTHSLTRIVELGGTAELRHALNQLMVAIGEFPLELAVTDVEGREMLTAVAGRTLFPPNSRGSQQLAPPQLEADPSAATTWAIDPQPRRDLVAGLLVHQASSDDSAFAAGTLYSLILPIVSIAEAEWFALWRKWITDNVRHDRSGLTTTAETEDDDEEAKSSGAAPAMQELYDLFRCGVVQLEYLGLVRERRSNAILGKAVYEKPVLVWCGGD